MSVDALIVMIALAIADNLRPGMSNLSFLQEVPEPAVPLHLYPVFGFIWVLILMLVSVYDGRRNLYVANELSSLTLGTLLAGVSLAGLLYLSYRDISRFLFLFFMVQVYFYTISWRLIVRLAFHLDQTHQNVRKVLIIGAGKVGGELHDQISQHPYMGLQVIGFLDDSTQKKGVKPSILGSVKETRVIVESNQIDDVVIALPRRAYDEVSKVVAELHDKPVKIWVIPDYFHLALHRAEISEFAGFPMLDLRAPALNEYQRLIKRVFDLIFSMISLVIFSPIMVAIAIAIKLGSPGPIFYKSQRLGENGQLFWMYKFRSMFADADQQLNTIVKFDHDGKILHKSPNDPRITKTGRFIRKTSLDELPQLLNVLKSEMSTRRPPPRITRLS